MKLVAIIFSAAWLTITIPAWSLDEDIADKDRLHGFLKACAGESGQTVRCQIQNKTEFDLFRLWNNCMPISLQILLDQNNTSIVLTEEFVTTAVRSRLRAAHLFQKDTIGPWDSWLKVSVSIMNPAFYLSFQFRKPMMDSATYFVHPVTSWDSSYLGIYGKGSDILSLVSKITDRFIDEYLRVNAEACKSAD